MSHSESPTTTWFEHLDETVEAILKNDPAARSRLEVILCYPGLHAVMIYRIANVFYKAKRYTLARLISQWARTMTGIEIHPGATIGRRFIIDHGMGVVIGETSHIGDDCFLYQGVTLGAGAEARQGEQTRNTKRHPTLGNGVVVGSGAEIQGAITVSDNARVASGSIVLKDVPPNSTVVGMPGRVIYRDGQRINEKLPDIEAEAIKSLKNRIEVLETLLRQLQGDNATNLASDSINQQEQDKLDWLDGNTESESKEDPVEVFLQGAGI
jgi:serine O-acetyltransferase